MWIETSKGRINTAHVVLAKWSITGSKGEPATHELSVFTCNSDMPAIYLGENEGMVFLRTLFTQGRDTIICPDELAPEGAYE